MDALLVLDFMKNFKTSFTNDFMWYKRTYPLSNQDKDDGGDKKANEELQAFLTARWSIIVTLKREIARTESVEQMLLQLLGFCVENLEGGHTVSYKDRLALLRVLPLLLVLVAPTDSEGEAVFRKKVKLDRVLQPLRREPVVSAFEEVHMVPAGIILELSPYFRKLVEEEKLELPLLTSMDETESASVYGLIPNLPTIQEAHDNYCLRFSAVNSKLRMVVESPARPGIDSVIGTSRVPGFGTQLSQEALVTALDGMVMLHSWTGKLVQHLAWKCSHPLRSGEASADGGSLKQEKVTVSSYERALRFNLKHAEKKAILDLLVLIKGVGGMMTSNAALFQQAVREAIHGEVQEFVRAPLSALLKKNGKKGKSEVIGMLLHLRAIVADWIGGSEHATIPRKSKSRMGTSTPVPNDLEQISPIMARPVPPSAAQVHSFLHVAHTLLLGPSSGIGNFFAEQDLATDELRSLYNFFHRLLIFPAVLDYHGTLSEATSVGFLWFREWYLELNRVLQFPIECSLPWMLVTCLLDEESSPLDGPLMDALLMPLGIYNDAANQALHSLHQQYLYDEIEAEVELCFGQLLLKLSDRIYRHYKARAASSLLDKSFFSVASAQSLQGSLRVFPHYFEGLLGKVNVQLVGRNISLSGLLTQRLNKVFRKNLYNILEYLEANDLSMLMQQLEVLRVTHQHLAEHLPLDSFSTMLMETSNATSLVSFSSNIASYVVRELEQDLLPNFIWCSASQRFVRNVGGSSRSVNRRAQPVVEDAFLFGTKDLNEAYDSHALLFSRFFGLPHARALVALLGPHSLPLVIQRTLNILTVRVVPALGSQVEKLASLMPNQFSLPVFQSTIDNCLNYINFQYVAVKKNAHLPNVVASLRDVGSVLAFLSLLDCALRETETIQVIQSAPWLGVVPGSHGQLQQLPSEADSRAPSDSMAAPFGDLLQKAAASAPSKGQELFGILQAAQVAEAMYWSGEQGESVLAHSLAVLGPCLASLKDTWAHPVIEGKNASKFQFHSLFSAIQFMSCYGDGSLVGDKAGYDALYWGGCTLMYLLGQERMFELHDYTYQILHMQEFETAKNEQVEIQGPFAGHAKKDVDAFLEFSRRIKCLNEHIFSMLRAHFPKPLSPAFVVNAQGARTTAVYHSPQSLFQPPDSSV